MSRHLHFTYLALCLALSSMIWSLSKGSTSIPFDQLLFSDNRLFQTIFFQFRLPRVLSAFTVGGLLALSGQLTQLLLQNPLADPYVLGISSGAALATLFMMLFGVSSAYLLSGAWLGSLCTMLVILFLAKKHQWQTHALLLSGIALSAGLSALISCILLVSPDKNLHSMLFWLAGDLSNTHLPWMEIGILFLAGSICISLAPGLDIFARGESAAYALGLPYRRYRITLYFLSSLLTAAAVTLAGCIGFIGLIIPHCVKRLIGDQTRYALLLSMLLGGSLLTLADTLARTLLAPQQLPVGMLMALIGTPLFIYLLYRRQPNHLPAYALPDMTTCATCTYHTQGSLLQTTQLLFGQAQKPLSPPCDISLKPGEIWGILGTNGSGKTTLIHTLAGLLTPLEGEILLNAKSLTSYQAREIAKKIGVLFQDTTPAFTQSVFAYCLAARFPHLSPSLAYTGQDEKIVIAALNATGLLSQRFANMQQLSGGEQRRAAFSALLAQTPDIFLLDEPTNHLDPRNQHRLLTHLQQLALHEQKSIMMSLHDINLAQRYCTHAILLSATDIRLGNIDSVLTTDNLSWLYQTDIKRYTHEGLIHWQHEAYTA